MISDHKIYIYSVFHLFSYIFIIAMAVFIDQPFIDMLVVQIETEKE